MPPEQAGRPQQQHRDDNDVNREHLGLGIEHDGIRADEAHNQRAGKRAISIKVEDEAKAVGYSIRPGHSVDVWGFVNGKSELLKKQACVMAVGGVYLAPDKEEAKDDDYKSVTIYVDEKDVECLTNNLWLAGRKTKITLVGDCNPNANFPSACTAPAQGPNVAGSY